jgi:hypothetical protein
MACWFRSDDTTINQTLMCISDTGTDVNYFRLSAMGASAGDPVRADTTATTTGDADTTTGFSANTWHHACGVFAGTADRRAFIDGGSKGTDVVNEVPTGLDTTAIGRLARLTPAGYTSGRIAEAAIWDVALSDVEVALLAKGYSPLFVRPASLTLYAPLLGNYSPEIDLIGARSLTVTGATKADHPRVFMPPPPLVLVDPAAGAVAPSSSAANLLLLKVG